ncbi:MAG TPA: hypothetical protein VKE98_04150, partial [Gemmataceae bacterium]|nr:hypothetical protein [Gemmataceae bacterium]
LQMGWFAASAAAPQTTASANAERARNSCFFGEVFSGPEPDAQARVILAPFLARRAQNSVIPSAFARLTTVEKSDK